MTDLTAERPVKIVPDGCAYEELPASAADLLEGMMIGVNSSGYARKFTLGDKFHGHLVRSCLNANNSAGDLWARVYKGRYRARVALSNVSITDGVLNSSVYAQDSGTLSLRAGFRVGRVIRYVSSGIAVVEFDTDPAIAVISQTCLKGDFTASSATGTLDLTTQLPLGAQPLGWEADVKTAFIGDTSCTVNVGVSGTLGKFSAVATQSCFTTGRIGSQMPVSASVFLPAATTVRLTLTSGSAFSSVSAGEMDFKLKYIPPLN